MGRRKGKQWDLPSGQTEALLVLGLAFFLGGLLGVLFAALSGGQGALALRDYLVDYLAYAAQGDLSGRFWPALWGQLQYLLAALLLGLTALGLFGLPLLFAIRGFLFSFSVACFCRVFGGVGLLPAFSLFGLPALLWAPALFLTGAQGLCRGRELLARTGEGRSPAIAVPVFWGLAALCLGLSVLCALLDVAAAPVLLRAAARVVL